MSDVEGSAALPHLVEAGYAVTAHSRSWRAREESVDWVCGDIATDKAALRKLLEGAAAVFDLRVALPTSLRTVGAIRQYREVRDTAF